MTKRLTEFTEIPGLHGVSVVRHRGDSPTTARHMHASLCVGAVLSGKRALQLAGALHTAHPGTLMIIPPRTAHTCPQSGQCEYIMVSVPVTWLDHFSLTFTPLDDPIMDDPTLFGLIHKMAAMAEHPASRLERQATLLALVSPLCAEKTDDAPTDLTTEMVAETQRYLDTNCAEDVPLSALARMAGCSPCRLNRTFASAVGMPPHQYQSLQRVQRVKQCIRNGLGLAESAVEAGFVDQSHMSRCFKRIMGMTPGTFAHGVAPPKTGK